VDEKIHVFTLRIWREPREIASACPRWRGVVIHIVGGEKKYFENLDDLLEFIMPYITEMGLMINQTEESSNWLDRWLTAWRKKSK